MASTLFRRFCRDISALLLFISFLHTPVWAFDLVDGDVVGFLGDSNTEWGSYPQIIEAYTHLRFPKRKITFYNGGKAGDTASTAAGWRLTHDVLNRIPKPTRVFVLFGVNDLALGDAEGGKMENLKQYYRDGVREILKSGKAQGVRMTFLSYPPVEMPEPVLLSVTPWLQGLARLVPAESPLREISQYALKVAREAGANTIDIQAAMQEAMGAPRKGGMPLYHWKDGLHLNEAGNQFLAAAILKGLHAPGVVSSVEIRVSPDGKSVVPGALVGAKLKELRLRGKMISFSRLDEGTPLVQGFYERGQEPAGMVPDSEGPADAQSRLRIQVPGTSTRVPAGLSAASGDPGPMAAYSNYILKITGLAEGKYQLEVDGIRIEPESGFSAHDLAEGVDLAHAAFQAYLPRTPWASISFQTILDGRRKALLEAKRLNLMWSGIKLPAMSNRVKAIDREIERASRISQFNSQPFSIRFRLSPWMSPKDAASSQ